MAKKVRYIKNQRRVGSREVGIFLIPQIEKVECIPDKKEEASSCARGTAQMWGVQVLRELTCVWHI